MNFPIIIFIIFFLQWKLISGYLSYNEACTNPPPSDISKQCDPYRGFQCKSNPNGRSFCGCAGDNLEYIRDWNSCTALLGANCTMTVLTQTEGRPAYWAWVVLGCQDDKAICIDGICKCHSPDYLPESGKIFKGNRCLPASAEAPCDEWDLPCHPDAGLKCSRRQVCACAHPIKQVYVKSEEKETGTCLSMPEIAQGCDPSNMETQCVPNAHCGDDSMCHCSWGYSPMQIPGTNQVHCRQDYLQSCIGNSTCNEMAGLTCFDGKCVCEDDPDMIYDYDLKECASPEGLPCSVHKYGSCSFNYYNGKSNWEKPVLCTSDCNCQRVEPGTHTNLGRCVKKPQPTTMQTTTVATG